MIHRRVCETCSHWSARGARMDDFGVRRLQCVSPHPGLLSGKYTGPNQSCSDWQAIDWSDGAASRQYDHEGEMN